IDLRRSLNVICGYDLRGRQTSVMQGMNQNMRMTTMTYNDANQVLTEAYTAGPLNGLTVTSHYDNYLRRSVLSLNSQPSTLNYTYGYDNASRLQTVSDAFNDTATYSYLANSPLVGQITFTQ